MAGTIRTRTIAIAGILQPMTDYALAAGRPQPPRSLIRRVVVALSILAAMGLAGAPIAYMLWPQPRPVAPDAPSLPITVGGVAFNVPPAAIRFKMQRRAGPQARVDLVFLWPSLEPPSPHAALSPADAPKVTERIFLTIAGSDGTLPPVERLKAIYPRYVVAGPAVNMGGLQVRPFRSGTPYQGEDLIYDAATPERFLMRCTQSFAATPGMCLHERRLGTADVTLRFPRDWLTDWRATANGIDRLIAGLRPAGG
jgi:hypothetical protein